MDAIPPAFHDLFDKATFAHFATLLPSGVPHVTPVWVDYDAERDHVLVNTVRGRRKERNVSRDPRVGVSMIDPDDSYRFCSVWGEVVEMTEDGAVAHIDDLARRYMGVDEYPNKDQEDGARVVLHVKPEGVATS
ncbi:TIGR03618 family F420-dependent PPOX class oxidoreductase [Haloarculaceae archaeon H-GB1-1]|nr:TIGR03618 family F420-dependent PPOX class oxidoreductase [Haloarculaceae archaeon H-GB1-1]